MQWIIKFYDSQKGFGFIIPEGDDETNVFYHITRCSEDYQEQLPKEGDVVSYDIEIGEDRDGNERASAVNVTFVSEGEAIQE